MQTQSMANTIIIIMSSLLLLLFMLSGSTVHCSSNSSSSSFLATTAAAPTIATAARKHKNETKKALNSTERLWAGEEVFFGTGKKKDTDLSAGPTWCVAKNNADDGPLQAALDFACGDGGADCTAIQQGGSCFDPDNVQSHASYAFNSYYIKNSMLPGTCDFNGTAAPTIQNPSYSKCVYQSSESASSSTSTGNAGRGATGATVLGPSSANPNLSGASGRLLLTPPELLLLLLPAFILLTSIRF